MEWVSQNWILLALGIGALIMMSRQVLGYSVTGHTAHDHANAGTRGAGDGGQRGTAGGSDATSAGTGAKSARPITSVLTTATRRFLPIPGSTPAQAPAGDSFVGQSCGSRRAGRISGHAIWFRHVVRDSLGGARRARAVAGGKLRRAVAA